MLHTELCLLRQQRSTLLKQKRIEKNITKEQLAESSTLTRPTIDRIESGKYSFTIDSELLYLHGLEIAPASGRAMYRN